MRTFTWRNEAERQDHVRPVHPDPGPGFGERLIREIALSRARRIHAAVREGRSLAWIGFYLQETPVDVQAVLRAL